MQVKDLIHHLNAYVVQSPENASAEVMLQYFDDMAYGIAGANNAKGMFDGQHMLIIMPDLKQKLGVKRMNIT